MTTRHAGPSTGPRTAPAARVAGLRLAVALLVPLLLAACGSDDVTVAPGGAGGSETPAPAPSATPAYCGLKPEGQAERTQDGMAFPATTDYLGKPVDEARKLAADRKLTLRVVGEDGECNAITDDLSTARINVYLERGVVTAVGAF